MKIFISWSGQRSHAVAEALGPWLKKMIQSTEYWLSSEMERGVKWLDEINRNLDEHSFGILCVTPGNVTRPWLNFEAGALSKHLGDRGRVIPYLLQFNSPGDLRDPLGQFNASVADKDGTWQLIQTLNKHAEYKREKSALREDFELRFPELGGQLAEIAKMGDGKQPPERRSTDDKIDDLLQLVRALRESASYTDLRTSTRTRQIALGPDDGMLTLVQAGLMTEIESVIRSENIKSFRLVFPSDEVVQVTFSALEIDERQLQALAKQIYEKAKPYSVTAAVSRVSPFH